MVGEHTLPDPADAASFTEYRNLTELGGFVAPRYFGAGEYHSKRAAALGSASLTDPGVCCSATIPRLATFGRYLVT